MSAYPVDGPIPPQQQKALAFIDAEMAAGNGFPSPETIAAYMGWKQVGSARDCLHKLRWRGRVRITRDYSWERIEMKENA